MRLPLLILGLAAATVGSGGAAAAQSTDGSAQVQATFRGLAAPGCRLSTPIASTAQNVDVGALAPGSADIAISQLVGDDGSSLGATVVLVLPAICNQAHTLTLASLNGGLLGDGPALTSGPFRSNLPYSVSVNWAGDVRSFVTDSESLAMPVGDAATGSVTVTIQIPPGGAPLAAGVYSDELVLELGAAG